MGDTEGRNSATSVSERTGRGKKGKKRRRRRTGAGREGGGRSRASSGSRTWRQSCVLGRRGWQVSGVAESGVSFTVF